MKSVSSHLKLGLSQFRELASFTQFGSDLDDTTKKQIERGQRLTELLKQHQYQPLSVWQQVVSILCVSAGHFDTVPVAKIKDAQAAVMTRIWADHKKEMTTLDSGAKPTEEMLKLIETVASTVAKGFNG